MIIVGCGHYISAVFDYYHVSYDYREGWEGGNHGFESWILLMVVVLLELKIICS